MLGTRGIFYTHANSPGNKTSNACYEVHNFLTVENSTLGCFPHFFAFWQDGNSTFMNYIIRYNSFA